MGKLSKVKNIIPSFMDFANETMLGAFEAVWNPFKSGGEGFYRGLSGTTHTRGLFQTSRELGDTTATVSLNPFQKHARQISTDIQQILTGRKHSSATLEPLSKTKPGALARGKNSLLGIEELFFDLTLGTAATAAGWGTRLPVSMAVGTGKSLGYVGYHTARAGARVLGGTVDAAASLAYKNTMGAYKIANDNLGSYVAFGGTAVGGTYLAGLGLALGETTPIASNTVSALPGTSKAVQRLVDTGADGNLVFSLHTLR